MQGVLSQHGNKVSTPSSTSFTPAMPDIAYQTEPLADQLSVDARNNWAIQQCRLHRVLQMSNNGYSANLGWV